MTQEGLLDYLPTDDDPHTFLAAAANDPTTILSAFPAQGLAASNMTSNVLDQNWDSPQGALEASFSQMTLATHNTKVKSIIDQLCDAVKEPEEAQRITKADAILAKSKEAFEVYTQQEAAINTSSSDSAPKIQFTVPDWDWPEVLHWANVMQMHDPFYKDEPWKPHQVHGVLYDTRRARDADEVDVDESARVGHTVYVLIPEKEGEPAKQEIPAREEEEVRGPDAAGHDRDPLPIRAYQPAKLAKPAIPEHRGFKKIVPGAVLKWHGVPPLDKEAKLITYIAGDKSSPNNIDLVATLVKFAEFANKSGYTTEMTVSFLTNLCQIRFGVRGHVPYMHLDPSSWANKLISIFFKPDPISRTKAAHDFVRTPDMSIQMAYNNLEMVYHDIMYFVHDKQARQQLVSERLYNDILSIVSPVLAQGIRQVRAKNRAMGVRHPIQYDLALISQSEELQEAFRPRADLRLKSEDISRANTSVNINAMNLHEVRMAFPYHAQQFDRLNNQMNIDINVATTNPNKYQKPFYSGPRKFPTGSQDPNSMKKFPAIRTPPGRPPPGSSDRPTTPSPDGIRPKSRQGSPTKNTSRSTSRDKRDRFRRFSGPQQEKNPKDYSAERRQTMADRVASIPDKLTHHQRKNSDNASLDIAKAAREADRRKQYREYWTNINNPLPSVPATVPPDSRGYRNVLDETMTNKYSQSPGSGKVIHSTINDAPGGQLKVFTPIRKGYPGEVGDRITSSRDTSPVVRDESPAGFPRNYPSFQQKDFRQISPDMGFPVLMDESPVRSTDKQPYQGQYQQFSSSSQSRSGGMATGRQSRSRYKEQVRTGRILNSENVAYWKGKTCTYCKRPDHGAHVCPSAQCRHCGLNGVHKTAVACEAARGAKAMQTLAFLPPPSRDQSRDKPRDQSRTKTEKMEINMIGLDEFKETHKALLSKMDETLKSVLAKNDEVQQE